MANVRAASAAMVEASHAIAAPAVELSERTEQAAGNLEHTAQSMGRIAATVQQTADTSQQAALVAAGNAQAAPAAAAPRSRKMTVTMESIQQASARIGDIVGVIDALAFQTNILALNAAVEAARAGEAGRGFAVVAAEVRTLAQRSADAARDIKALIGDSVAKVSAGTVVVGEAGSAISALLEFSRRVDGLPGEIATGARERSQGVGQIGQAILQLDRLTQENAALAEQTASAATSMKGQADAMAAEVSRFKLLTRARGEPILSGRGRIAPG